MTLIAGLGSAIASGGGSAGSAGNLSFSAIIAAASLTTNNQVCLDAGAIASYPGGSAQTWISTATGAYSFYRGTGSGSDTHDPTFNGVAGTLSSSEYFSLDGGDQFILNQTNPAWVQTYHKAAAVLTIIAAVYVPSVSSAADQWTSCGDGYTGNGFQFGFSATSKLSVNFSVYNGVTTVYTKDTATKVNQNAWNFISVSVNATSGNVIFVTNGTSETFTSQAYSSPAAGNASETLALDSPGGTAAPTTMAGSRRAITGMWDTNLSSANLVSFYTSLKSRFGF